MECVRVAVLLLVLCIAQGALAQAPPPPYAPDGYAFGSPAAPVTLEMHGDLQCPDCSGAWPIMVELLDFYGPDLVNVKFHDFPLVLHHNSFDAAAALFTVARQNNTKLTKAFVSDMFKSQQEFFNGVTFNKTRADVQQIFVKIAGRHGVSEDVLVKGMNSDEAIMGVALSSAYQSLAGVWSTPTFFLNGALAEVSFDVTNFQAWIEYLTPYVTAAKAAKAAQRGL